MRAGPGESNHAWGIAWPNPVAPWVLRIPVKFTGKITSGYRTRAEQEVIGRLGWFKNIPWLYGVTWRWPTPIMPPPYDYQRDNRRDYGDHGP